jgi:hypothetical protein
MMRCHTVTLAVALSGVSAFATAVHGQMSRPVDDDAPGVSRSRKEKMRW